MRVQFLKDTSKAILPNELNSKKTIVVYREGYALPQLSDAEYIDFEKFKITYNKFEPEYIVMVGTNRIFVPANRCDLVFEYLQTMTPNIQKYSIDTQPFIGEPWRLWFHYSLAFGQWLNINYSYAVETDWQHWFYRESESSIISAENISKNKIETHSDLNLLATSFDFYQPDLFLIEHYNEVKKIAFEKYATPKQIIQFMLKALNNHIEINFDFDSFRDNKKHVLPDLNIYRFCAEECSRRIKIYNSII